MAVAPADHASAAAAARAEGRVHFIGQTITRNNRYQVYLAMYCGTGLALAVACATTFHGPVATRAAALQTSLRPTLNGDGLHVVMPLLLFWVVAGLRTAFASPLNLSAGWIFRVTGMDLSDCAGAARRWVFLCALGLVACTLAALRITGWDGRYLLVQLGCGLCLCVLMIDGFFWSQQAVPFNRARLPGKTNLPLMLTLYVGVLPPFLFGMIALEKQMERNLGKLLWVVLLTVAMHTSLSFWRRARGAAEEQPEEYEGEFQLLGLSFR